MPVSLRQKPGTLNIELKTFSGNGFVMSDLRLLIYDFITNNKQPSTNNYSKIKLQAPADSSNETILIPK